MPTTLPPRDALRDHMARPDTRARLLNVARRVTSADPEDAVHDGIVQALAAAERFRGQAAPGTWMHRIVVNAALMRRRRTAASDRRIDRVRRELPTDVGAASAPDPAHLLERAQESARLATAVEALPPIYREATTSYLLGDEGLADVAARLGLLPSTLRVRAARARRLLANALDA
jgi:RNA polymerase sigma-70 factor (ECF subfamily)